MRLTRTFTLGLWLSTAPVIAACAVLGISAPALAAAPKVKVAHHSGAFSISLPVTRTRIAMRVELDPAARTVTLSVPGKDLLPSRVITLPELRHATSTWTTRSELIPLAGGEQALVLYFGAPKPYVLVLLGPTLESLLDIHRGVQTDRSLVLADAVVLKGFMGGTTPSESSLTATEGPDGLRLILSEPVQTAPLCGHSQRATHALDPARGRFARVAVPLLGAEQRRGAKRLPARVQTADAGAAEIYLGALPSPFEVDAVVGKPLTDAKAEPVEPYAASDLSLAASVGVDGLVVRVAQPSASDASWDLWLWTPDGIFEVDTSGVRDASAFVVDLPSELRKGCLAVTVGARPPFVEITGRLSGGTHGLTSAGGELGANDGDVNVRRFALAQPSVVPGLARSYRSLSPAVRVAAESLARLAEPSVAESFWIAQLLGGNEGERNRAQLRLDGFPDGGRGAFARALESAGPRDELPLARALGALSAPVALRPIASRLGQRSPARRLELRKVLAELSADPQFLEELNRALVDPALPRAQKVELLRAVAPITPRLTPAAQKEALALLETAPFSEAYVLVSVALELSTVAPAAKGSLLAWADGKKLGLSERMRAALRTELMTVARDSERVLPELSRLALELLDDSFPSVRASAAGYLEVAPLAAANPALQERLRRDDWPVVRQGALGALASLRADASQAKAAEAAMIRALAKDDEPSVRARAARTLDEVPRPETLAALRKSLSKDESAVVRAEAARSLGRLCDASSTAALTASARGLTRGAHDEADVRLGLNSVTALARLNPPDLDERLAPLTAKSVPGPLRGRVESAIESGRGGCASAKEQ